MYYVKMLIRFQGKIYKANEEIELDESQALKLLKAGIVFEKKQKKKESVNNAI